MAPCGTFWQTTMPLRTWTHRSSPPSLRVGEVSDGCALVGGVPAGAGAIIVSNRLAAIIKFASVLTTDSRTQPIRFHRRLRAPHARRVAPCFVHWLHRHPD